MRTPHSRIASVAWPRSLKSGAFLLGASSDSQLHPAVQPVAFSMEVPELGQALDLNSRGGNTHPVISMLLSFPTETVTGSDGMGTSPGVIPFQLA